MKPPTITLDKANNTITMTAKGKSLSISEAIYTDMPPTQIENLVHAMLCVMANAVTVATCMLVFAVVFGGKPLDEIKESIRKGNANETANI